MFNFVEKILLLVKYIKLIQSFMKQKKAAEIHIGEKHSSMLQYLLNMNSSFTGISEVQKRNNKPFFTGIIR